MALKRRKLGLKILLSIGGGSGSQHFAALASEPAVQERFAQAAALLVRSHGFDGVDCESSLLPPFKADKTNPEKKWGTECCEKRR